MMHYYKSGERLVLSYKQATCEFWDEHWRSHVNTEDFQSMVATLKDKPLYSILKHAVSLYPQNAKVLEAGCGPGIWVEVLKDDGFDAAGVDFSYKTLQNASQNLACPFACGDVEKLPFQDKSFHIVLSFGVMEHFQEGPENALKEACRVLKPGGMLFVSVPYYNPFRRMKNLFRFHKTIRNCQDFYAYFFSRQEFHSILTRTGFHVQKAWVMEGASGLKADFSIFKNVTMAPRLKNENHQRQHKTTAAGAKQLLKKLCESTPVTSFFGHMILFVVKKQV